MDNISCLLYPGTRPLSKIEKNSILKIIKAARKRAYIAAGYTPISETIPSTLPDLPIAPRPVTPPGTALNLEESVID
jgi:hypothetical protein